MSRVRRWIIGGQAVRTFLEALFTGFILLLAWTWLGQTSPDIVYLSNFVTAVLAVILIYCLRLQIPAGPWYVAIIYELLFGHLVIWGLAWFLFDLGQTFTPPDVLTRINAGPLAEAYKWLFQNEWIVFLSSIVSLRFTKYAWSYWQWLRPQRLIWQVTQVQLTLVLYTFILMGLLLSALTSFTSDNFLWINFLLQNANLFILFSGPLLIVLLLILMPASVLAYSTARRFTKRLYQLVQATSQLRAGDYSTRVVVSGQDEVATLQANFNAMSEQLEQTLAALQQERDTVTEVLQSRRDLFVTISHDLRTPVAVLRGYIEGLKARDGDASTIRPDLETMETQIVHLQTLLDDLFVVARAVAGGLAVQMAPLDVGLLIEQVVNAAANHAWRQSKVQLIADITPELPLMNGDQTRLEQILNNLIQNGVRHTPPGGLVIVAAHSEAETIVLEVKDTGVGILANELPYIWDRAYRASNSQPGERQGTGLGLTLVKELTEAMGGTISVTSEPDLGSCFTLRFATIL